MTLAKSREASADLHADRDDIPQATEGRGWQAGLKYGAAPSWTPAIDISESPDAYLVTVEIPGIAASEVRISMRDGILAVQGRRRAALGAAGEKTHRSERGYGAFRRLVTLPSSHVRGDRAEATVRDGVLRIRVPKAPEAQAGLIRLLATQEETAATPAAPLCRGQDMTITGGEAAVGTTVPPAGPPLRLRLRPVRSGPALLDGGW